MPHFPGDSHNFRAAAIVLAAGASRRMGRPKLLLPFRGRPLLAWTLDAFRTAGVSDVLVVTGAVKEEVAVLAAESGARPVWNPDHANGEMLDSVKCGIRALPPDTDCLLICPGDLPLLQASTIRALLLAAGAEGGGIYVPTSAGRRGHPLLLAGAQWAGTALLLQPPETLRTLLDRHSECIHSVAVDDAGALTDIDTVEELEAAGAAGPSSPVEEGL